MTQHNQRSGTARGLLALTVLAISARWLAVLLVGSFMLERVTYEHGEIARNLVAGRGFQVRWLGGEGPTSTQSPLYPPLLAACYWLFGLDSPVAVLALELVQATLGGLIAPLLASLCFELLPSRRLVGWLAGLGACLYPTLVYAVTQVQVAWLASLLTVAVLWMSVRAARLGSAGWALAGGVAGGLLILTDPILSLVVLVGIAVVVAWRASGAEAAARRLRLSKRFGLALLLAGTAALVLCPWTVRNWLVHGELVPVKTTFGYAFWQGNHPRSWGTDKIPLASAGRLLAERGRGTRGLEQALWQARLLGTLYIDDAVLSAAGRAALGRLSEPQRSRRLLAEACSYIRRHPGHYIRLCLHRLRYFLWFDPTNPKSRVAVYRAAHAALNLLALAGLCLSAGQWRRLWPTYLTFLLVTAFHTLTIVSVRFHIPLEPLLLLWAACVPTCSRLLSEHGRAAGNKVERRTGRWLTIGARCPNPFV